MFGAVVSQVKALDKAISGKAAGSSQKALDVDDTSPIALLALETHTEHLGDTSLSAALPTIQSSLDPQKIAWTRNVVLPCGSIDGRWEW